MCVSMMEKTVNDRIDKPDHRLIVWWLFGCAGLVLSMVVVGAITRLTDSGLSMVEWRPLMGALPPLHEAEWQRVFDLYKQSPEFDKKHFWMSLADFKMIFFWEWSHRLLGRLIGLAYFVPLVWFWITNKIPTGYKPKFLFLLILGGAQGLMGWYMVQSGLVDRPSVSHYRLAAHLSLAFIIFGFLLWYALSVRALGRAKRSIHRDRVFGAHMMACFVLLSITIIWGALTAGLDAGLLYNDSFPKMGGHWIPPDALQHSPLWVNAFEAHSGVQLVHRWLAILTSLSIISLWFHGRIKNINMTALQAAGIMVIVQFSLGLLTLFSHVALPLAAAHQAGALVLLSVLLACFHRFYGDEPG